MLDIDEKTKSLDRTSMAKICVEINLRDGLQEDIDIWVGNRSYQQETDYVKIPFKCSICHVYRHLRCTCPKKDIPADKEVEEPLEVGNKLSTNQRLTRRS
jgi:hypothetical protein